MCTADIFKPRDYLVRGKSVFSYCGIILLTRPDYTFSRRATFSPDAFIKQLTHSQSCMDQIVLTMRALGGSKGNFGEFWGTFFWGTPENPGDFPKIPQNSPKIPKTKFQILLTTIAIAFNPFIFIYLLPIIFWYSGVL